MFGLDELGIIIVSSLSNWYQLSVMCTSFSRGIGRGTNVRV